MEIRIKYFKGATKLTKIKKGNWIDVYSNETMFIAEGTVAMIPLGFALELPEGWEGHLAPRSSTFKKWGIIQVNSPGIIDDTFKGDEDQWHMPVYCLKGNSPKSHNHTQNYINGTHIFAGDKIGQFRIMEVMPDIEFKEVEYLGNENRGGFGSTDHKLIYSDKDRATRDMISSLVEASKYGSMIRESSCNLVEKPLQNKLYMVELEKCIVNNITHAINVGMRRQKVDCTRK